MKKVFNSFYVLMLLFLSSCASNENVDTTTKGTSGTLVTKINFGSVTRANAESSGVPNTSWNDVKQVQLFLYKKTTPNEVAYSAIFNPSEISETATGQKTLTWTNVPTGEYNLALVANINSASDAIRTSWDNGSNWNTFDAYNVRGKSGIFVDSKEGVTADFPQGHTWQSSDLPYSQPSEVFATYKNDGITIGTGDNVIPGDLTLKREISLMRVRVDRTKSELANVNFNHDKSFIVIHRLPKGLEFGFEKSSVSQISIDDRILIGSKGVSTFKEQDPLTDDYSVGTKIIDSKHTLWQEIKVFPNTLGTQDTDAIAKDSRQYFIVIAGWAPAGYLYADGVTKAPEGGAPVYWYGLIRGVFSPNVIREVNLTIKSTGTEVNPPNPTSEGGLTITLGAPMPWNSNIVSETIEL